MIRRFLKACFNFPLRLRCATIDIETPIVFLYLLSFTIAHYRSAAVVEILFKSKHGSGRMRARNDRRDALYSLCAAGEKSLAALALSCYSIAAGGFCETPNTAVGVNPKPASFHTSQVRITAR